MLRNIMFEGATNFRDIGGYETSDGYNIKKGLVYRSDHLSNLTSGDLKIIKDLNIKTICDFRSDLELIENPSLFDELSLPKLLHIPIKTLGTQDLKELSSRDDITSQELANALEGHYVLYVNQHKEKYSTFLKNIAFEEIPIVFHCFAGKDRTGFAALLLLGLMGVKKETIIEDYLLTNKYYKGPTSGSNWSDVISEKIKPLFEARAEYINAAFNEIQSRYKDIEEFVVKELNIDFNVIDRIKSKILE